MADTIIVQHGNERLDVNGIRKFSCRQLTQELTSRPLGSPPVRRIIPQGWQVEFELDPADVSAQPLAALLERISRTQGTEGGSASVEQLFHFSYGSNESGGSIKFTHLTFSPPLDGNGRGTFSFHAAKREPA
jgi:hypothetical protein